MIQPKCVARWHMQMVEPTAKRRLRQMHLASIYDYIAREEKLPLRALCKVPGHHAPDQVRMPTTAEPLQQSHGLVALSGVRFPAVACRECLE